MSARQDPKYPGNQKFNNPDPSRAKKKPDAKSGAKKGQKKQDDKEVV